MHLYCGMSRARCWGLWMCGCCYSSQHCCFSPKSRFVAQHWVQRHKRAINARGRSWWIKCGSRCRCAASSHFLACIFGWMCCHQLTRSMKPPTNLAVTPWCYHAFVSSPLKRRHLLDKFSASSNSKSSSIRCTSSSARWSSSCWWWIIKTSPFTHSALHNSQAALQSFSAIMDSFISTSNDCEIIVRSLRRMTTTRRGLRENLDLTMRTWMTFRLHRSSIWCRAFWKIR